MIVEREPAAIAQLHDGNCGKRLGDRAVMEERSFGYRFVGGAIRKAMLVMLGYVPVLYHQHAGTNNFVAIHSDVE